MKNNDPQKLIIEAENKKTEFSHLETYKITSTNENLSSKISLVKANSTFNEKAKQPVDNIIAVACLEDQFKFIHYHYNYQNIFQVSTKNYELAFNPKNIGKVIQSVVLLYDRVKKKYLDCNDRVYLAVGTDKMALIQDLEDIKFYRVLYDNTSASDLGTVTNFFEIPPYIQNDFHMLVQFNENILLEVDINRKDVVNESTISTFINKNKSDENSKFLKYEYNVNTPNHLSYNVLVLTSKNKNPKFVWKFNNENIIIVKFRPKNPNFNSEYTYQYKSFKNNTNLNNNTHTIPTGKQKLLKENHIAISLSSNRVCIFHYETKALIAVFKSYYGSIISLEYSFDGRLLALGTESDQIYIVDPEYNILLYCLEGHKNFVTNLTFFEEIVDEEEANEYNTYDSNRNDLKSDYNTNTILTIINNKEMSIEEMMKIINIEDNKSNIDIRQLRRARSSLMNKFIESEEMKSNITYDLFSSAMDGMIGVWRVEHFFEQHYVNEANYCFSFSNSNNALSNPFKILELFPHENLKIPYTSLTKVCTIPIIYHYINENTLIFIGKRNSKGSTVSMKFYYGNTKEEEEEVKEKSIYQPKEETSQIRSKARRDSFKANSNEEREKSKQQKKENK